MKLRIPLRIEEGRVILTAVVECPSLRIHKSLIEFVVDTGSPVSFLSERDVKRFHVPLGFGFEGEIDFGGSRFKQVSLPKITMYLLPELREKDEPLTLSVSLSALKTTKTSPVKVQIAQTLPSILGLNFLREQKLSLHVILTEELVYLQYEG